MIMRVAFVLVLLLAVQLILESNAAADSEVLCKEKERQALLDFKLSFTADPYDMLTNWSNHNPECCNWEGVDCDEETGHVVSINMPSFQLESHQLRPSLLVLQHLTSLDLSTNNFSMRIPEFIGSLTKLTDLDLSSSGFFGKIPRHLGNLTNLQTLRLREPSFGILHADNLQWLTPLSSLQTLDLSATNLSGATDWLSILKMLPSLIEFDCSSCSLPNAPPSMFLHNHSSSLQNLDVSHNLIDTLPDLSKFSSLSYLVASFNKINGSLDAILQHLPTNLTSLSLSTNSLTDVISDSHFSNFSSLESLDLSDNYHLTFKFSHQTDS